MQQRRRILPMMILTALGLAGCSTSNPPATQPVSWTDQARNDPFNYNPNMDDWPTVSGGGISHFDKHEFNRDLDHVLNP